MNAVAEELTHTLEASETEESFLPQAESQGGQTETQQTTNP